MKGRREKFIFVAIATFFAFGIFVVSVFATLQISANLSGSFNFSVPKEDFFFVITAKVEGNRDNVTPFYHPYDNLNKTATTWNLDGLNFTENNQGEIEDIVFVFEVTNQNTAITERSGRVRVSYELVSKDNAIVLTPSENLASTIELAALMSVEDENQIDNKATFSVALSPLNRIPTNNLISAEFQYKLIFEFV